MSIAIRPPEADLGEVDVATDTAVVLRPGDGPIDMDPPPGTLLPSGGGPARDPASAFPRALALDALRLLRRWHGVGDRPKWWSESAFLAELETVRGQLAPLHSRRSLADSFGRESWWRSGAGPATAALSPVRVAYALRWRELAHDRIPTHPDDDHAESSFSR
jgi:hypothetical protein